MSDVTRSGQTPRTDTVHSKRQQGRSNSSTRNEKGSSASAGSVINSIRPEIEHPEEAKIVADGVSEKVRSDPARALAAQADRIDEDRVHDLVTEDES